MPSMLDFADGGVHWAWSVHSTFSDWGLVSGGTPSGVEQLETGICASFVWLINRWTSSRTKTKQLPCFWDWWLFKGDYWCISHLNIYIYICGVFLCLICIQIICFSLQWYAFVEQWFVIPTTPSPPLYVFFLFFFFLCSLITQITIVTDSLCNRSGQQIWCIVPSWLLLPQAMPRPSTLSSVMQ